MPALHDHQPRRLNLHVVLLEVGALILALSVIAFSRQNVMVWLLSVIVIVLHTLLFYRLGKISERLAARGSPDFFRGFKQGLMGRPD